MSYCSGVTYRDEKDSLYARIQELEADNARLREAAGEQPAATVAPTPPASSGPVLAFIAGLIAVGLLLGFAISVARPSRKRTPVTFKQVAASWNARVLEAEGVTLAPGTPCQIATTGSVTSDGSNFLTVTVRCGERTLYSTLEARKHMSGGGMTEADFRARQEPGATGYRMLYNESSMGARDYPSASVDTARRMALIRQEMTPKMRVALEVDPQSQPLTP